MLLNRFFSIASVSGLPKGGRGEEIRSLSLSLLYSPFPQKRLRTQAIFFTMRCSSLLPTGVGERRFPPSLSLPPSLFFASLFPLRQKRLILRLFFSQWGALLFILRGWGRGDSLSLFRFSLPPRPETPDTQAIFFTMGCSSLHPTGVGERRFSLSFSLLSSSSPRNA